MVETQTTSDGSIPLFFCQNRIEKFVLPFFDSPIEDIRKVRRIIWSIWLPDPEQRLSV